MFGYGLKKRVKRKIGFAGPRWGASVAPGMGLGIGFGMGPWWLKNNQQTLKSVQTRNSTLSNLTAQNKTASTNIPECPPGVRCALPPDFRPAVTIKSSRPQRPPAVVGMKPRYGLALGPRYGYKRKVIAGIKPFHSFHFGKTII